MQSEPIFSEIPPSELLSKSLNLRDLRSNREIQKITTASFCVLQCFRVFTRVRRRRLHAVHAVHAVR